MTTPQTNADNSDGVSNTPNNTSTASGNQSQSLIDFSGLTAPFTNWVGTIEADTANFANQVLNSIFYGLAALVGLFGIAFGLYKIFGNAELGSIVESGAKVAAFL